MTPLDWADDQGNEEIMGILKKGANKLAGKEEL